MPSEWELPSPYGLACTTSMSLADFAKIINWPSMYPKPPEREIDRMERELHEAQARVSAMVRAPEWKGAT